MRSGLQKVESSHAWHIAASSVTQVSLERTLLKSILCKIPVCALQLRAKGDDMADGDKMMEWQVVVHFRCPCILQFRHILQYYVTIAPNFLY